MQAAQAKCRNWNPWPVCLIAFFSVAILSCASFIAFCSLHPSDLVAPDYYEQEMRYQAQMSRIDNARELAPSASVHYDASSKSIIVSLPILALGSHPSGTILLYRPSASSLDRKLDLTLDQGGVQRIDARSLAPGLWKVRVAWTAEDKSFYVDQAVVIPALSA